MQELSLEVSSIKNHVSGDSHKCNVGKRHKTQMTLHRYKKVVEIGGDSDL